RRSASAVVRAAFLSLSKQVHPDHCRDADAATAFKKLHNSYQTLRSPARRRACLQYEQRRLRDESSTVLVTMDLLTQPWVLTAAVGLYLGAELVRLGISEFADDATTDAPPPPPPETIEVRRSDPPLSPLFSVSPGEPLVGPTRAELGERLHACGVRTKPDQ
ncbi:hypothetical protein CTAYLR_010558, partial [Chrysophaeum taylorii]